jgi:hypothetical protein
MRYSQSNQRGFASAALLVAVVVGFFAALSMKTEDGTTLAEVTGFVDRQSDFAAMEVYEQEDTFDEGELLVQDGQQQ